VQAPDSWRLLLAFAGRGWDILGAERRLVSSSEHTDTGVVFQDTLTSGLPSHAPWESARVIPSGMLPAVLWAQNPPRFLRIAGDQLVWLAWTVCSHSEVWAVRIDELGRAAPRRLETFSPRLCEYEAADGEVESMASEMYVGAPIVVGEWIYAPHPDGVARISLACAPTTFIPLDHQLAFGEHREVHHLAVIGNQVCCTGYVVDEGGQRRAIFLARVAPGMPETLWETASTGEWVDVQLTTDGHQLWFCAEKRLYWYCAGQVIELEDAPDELYQLGSLPGGLFATDGHGNLMALDPTTGAFSHTILADYPGALESMTQIGGWICLSTWDGEHTTILAARTDGSQSRCIARVAGSAGELCTDGRSLYWAWTSSEGGCICQTPLERDGAPAPVAASPPDKVRPRREPQKAMNGKVSPRGLPPPDTVDTVTRALAHQVVAAALDPTVAAPSPTQSLLVPWYGWLFLALVRYRAAQLEVIRSLVGGTIPRPEKAEQRCTMWCDFSGAKRTWSSREQYAMTLRIREVGDGVHAVIDPDWLIEWDFSQYIQRRRAHCPIAARLWHWLPARDLVAKLTGWALERFGGLRDVSDGVEMLRLPEELERLAQSPLGLASLAGDLIRAARWLGDPEIGYAEDLGWCEQLRLRYRRMINELIDLGEDSVVDALPALFDGPALTDACDYHLATCAATDTFTMGRIVALLQEHPQAPPSRVLRRLVVEVTPMHPDRLRWFAAALPYLCERGIELETVRAKLRLLAGLEQPLLGTPDWSPSVEAMLSALVNEPEAGRVIVASTLRHQSSYTVENAAVLLIAIAAPWCAALLETAQPCSPHPGIIDAALSWLGLRTAPTTPEHPLEWGVELSRKSIERLHELQRAALQVEGVDN